METKRILQRTNETEFNQTNQSREKIQINKIRTKKEDFSIDTTEFQRIIREYLKNLYSKK
jgi:hypothetical protein